MEELSAPGARHPGQHPRDVGAAASAWGTRPLCGGLREANGHGFIPVPPAPSLLALKEAPSSLPRFCPFQKTFPSSKHSSGFEVPQGNFILPTDVSRGPKDSRNVEVRFLVWQIHVVVLEPVGLSCMPPPCRMSES